MLGEKLLEVKTEDLFSDISEMCQVFLNWHGVIGEMDEVDNYSNYADAYAAMEAFLSAQGVEFTPFVASIHLKDNISRIYTFFKDLKEIYKDLFDRKIAVESIDIARNKYQQKLKVGFGYVFTDGDLDRIQILINEIRDHIAKSEDFTAEHKDRILRRLERLQSELHKRISSLDKLWGLIGEAGVVLGKFGKDAKPLVDRIREIAQITWNTQSRAEELPTGTKIPLIGTKQDVIEKES